MRTPVFPLGMLLARWRTGYTMPATQARGKTFRLSPTALDEPSNPPQEIPGHQQHKMQTERRIILVGQAGMRSRRVQPTVEAVDETVPLSVPLIQTRKEKWRIPVGKPLPSLMPSGRQLRSGRQMLRNLIAQALDEYPELSVCRRPVSANMRANSLIQMPLGNREAVAVQQRV